MLQLITEREGLPETGWNFHWKEETIGKEDQDGTLLLLS